MSELSKYILDGKTPVEDHDSKSSVEQGINLLDIAAKSAIYSALQQPMDGLCQLVGASAPKVFDGPKHYDFNTPQWYASTIGHGAGFMLPYYATSKVTGLAGMKNPGVGKAMLDGGLSGFLLTPTAEGENALATRGMAAFSSSVMFGTQHLVAGQLNSRLLSAAAERPALARTLNMTGLPTATRLGINTFSGTVAGLTGLEASSLISGNGFVTDAQPLIENAVASAATGFALDSMNIAAAKVKSYRNGAEAAKAQPTGDSELAGNFAEHAETGERAPAKTTVTRFTEPHRQIGEWTDPTKAIVGSKQYMAQTTGKTFWQTPDGRIFHVEGEGATARDHIWAPYGSGRPAAYLLEVGKTGSHEIFVRDEAQGFSFSQGKMDNAEIYNMYADPAAEVMRPPLTPEQAYNLALRMPYNLEPDGLAAARLLRVPGSAPYEPIQMSIRVPVEGTPPKGISSVDYLNNWTVEQTVPGRSYQILSAEGATQMHDLRLQYESGALTKEAHAAEVAKLKEYATTVNVPEDYAKHLDTVRNLRRTAILDPEKSPELKEDILKARRELFLSPFRDRLPPEHWGQFLELLPNRQIVKELQLLDTPDPDNPGMSTIADTNLKMGRIRFFGDHNGIQQHVRRTLLHEWAHTAEESQKNIFQAYEGAIRIEKFIGREYAGKNAHENWAVHFAEMLMDPNPEVFMTIAEKAPIRTALLAEAMKREMYASDKHQALNMEDLQGRLEYIDKHVVPKAREAIAAELGSNDVRRVTDATQLLDNLTMNGTAADRALGERLLDRGALVSTIDASTGELAANWDAYKAGSTLARYELLRHIDAEAAEPREQAMMDMTNRLRKQVSRVLTHEDAAMVGTGVDFAESLMRNDAGSASLFRRVVQFDDLAGIARSNPDAKLAQKSFTMLDRTFTNERVRAVALDMLQAQGSARGTAAEFLLGDSDTRAVMTATDILRKNVRDNNRTAFTKPAVSKLFEKLDQHSTDIIEGRDQNVGTAVRTLARARLLEEYALTRNDYFDERIQLRLERALALEDAVAKIIEAKRKGTEAEQGELVKVWQQIPTGTFTMPQRQSDNGIFLLR